MNTIENLAQQYENSAAIVKERISDRNRRIKQLEKHSAEAGILRFEIGVLRRELTDTLRTAQHLREYYGEVG